MYCRNEINFTFIDVLNFQDTMQNLQIFFYQKVFLKRSLVAGIKVLYLVLIK